jgi:hypothetical protein
MASLTYETPAGGGYQASIPGTSSLGLGGSGWGGEFDWIADLARRSALNKLAKQNLELKMMGRAYQQPGQLGTNPNMGPEGQLASMRRRAEMSKLQAEMGRAPTKMVNVGNSPAFETEDPYAMNAYQRQLFLPQGASFSGPSLAEMDEMGRDRSISDLQRMGVEDAEQIAARRALLDTDAPNPSRGDFEWRRRMSTPYGMQEEQPQSRRVASLG